MFALIDCNNFFVSCERVFNPRLKHKPVIVLSNNDGCVVARSNEVKKLGVPMGIPLFKIQSMVKKHHIQVFSSNFELYGDMSERVMQTIQQLSRTIEVYSIDEAFLSLDNNLADIHAFANYVRARVIQWTGIPVSVGLAPTKTLAKLANYLAKTLSTSGVFSLIDAGTRTLYLQQLPVEEVWGVGRQLAPALQHLGIKTAYDLSCYPIKQLRRRFGVMVERMALELQGHACLGSETVRAKQSIQSSRSFGRAVTSLVELQEAISTYAAKACEKLRMEARLVQTLCVYLRTSRFQGDTSCDTQSSISRDPQSTTSSPLKRHGNYTQSISICNEASRGDAEGVYKQYMTEADSPWTTKLQIERRRVLFRCSDKTESLPTPTDDSREVITLAKRMMADLFVPGYRYAKCGIVLMNLIDNQCVQKDMFTKTVATSHTYLMKTIDHINKKHGKSSVCFAAEGLVKPWVVKSGARTPRYTTHWDELARVH